MIAPETAAHAAGTSALLPMLALGLVMLFWPLLAKLLLRLRGD